jgi:hypothetical protein
MQIHIRVSNFGRLALVCPERPGCYDDEAALVLIADTDCERVESSLDAIGYVCVTEEILSMPRSIAGRWEDAKQPDGVGGRLMIETWYYRFSASYSSIHGAIERAHRPAGPGHQPSGFLPVSREMPDFVSG